MQPDDEHGNPANMTLAEMHRAEANDQSLDETVSNIERTYHQEVEGQQPACLPAASRHGRGSGDRDLSRRPRSRVLMILRLLPPLGRDSDGSQSGEVHALTALHRRRERGLGRLEDGSPSRRNRAVAEIDNREQGMPLEPDARSPSC
jgi:hypothetical protein